MEDRLSTRATNFEKIAAPVLSLLLVVWLLWDIRSLRDGDPILLVLAAANFGVALWWGWTLKSVVIDGSTLRVSGISKQIEIPLAKVVDAEQVHFPSPCRIKVFLSCDTDFGDVITFKPRPRFHLPFGPHPVLKELQARILEQESSVGAA